MSQTKSKKSNVNKFKPDMGLDDIIRHFTIKPIEPGVNSDFDNQQRYYNFPGEYLRYFNEKWYSKHGGEPGNNKFDSYRRTLFRFLKMYYK